MRRAGGMVVRGVAGAIAGLILGTAFGLFVVWVAFGFWEKVLEWWPSMGMISGLPGAFVGAAFAQAAAKRRYVASCFIEGAVGAVIGMIGASFVGLMTAPRHWVTLGWMDGVFVLGGGAGVLGGIVVAAISWLLREWTVVNEISRRIDRTSVCQHRVVRKIVKGLLGGLIGLVVGVVAGLSLEVAVAMRTLLLSPEGMLFFVEDLTGAGYVVSGVSIALGAAYGLVGKMTAQAARRGIIGLASGLVFGLGCGVVMAVTGAIQSASIRDCITVAAALAVAASMLGVPVGLIGGLVGRFTE